MVVATGLTKLDGWKAITEFMDRGERAVRRRVKAGMPVYKDACGSVFAYKEEIIEWERKRSTKVR